MKKMKVILALSLSLMLAGCASSGTVAEEVSADKEIILATTTSTQDSGLLDEILPDFEEKTGYDVSVISVGSGEAMKMGENGEADVLLVHSPAAEQKFVENNHADKEGRKDVMYNDFILIGPKGETLIHPEASADILAAFRLLSENQTDFISRSDESGTHKKELTIWEKCEIEPEGDWYVQAGTGMGAVLEMANEMQAYTLSDRATWLNLKEGKDLEIVSEKDASGILYNQYGVICVNPEKNDRINYEGAKAFREWILDRETQEMIGEYGVDKYGIALFTPNADK